MVNQDPSEHWTKLIGAIVQFTKDADAGKLPKVRDGTEATFQASLFHELINQGYSEVELEKSVGENDTPDLVIGDMVVCEIKTSLSREGIDDDLIKIERYVGDSLSYPISALIANGDCTAVEGFEEHLKEKGYSEQHIDVFRENPDNKSYCFFDYEKSSRRVFRRIYAISHRRIEI